MRKDGFGSDIGVVFGAGLGADATPSSSSPSTAGAQDASSRAATTKQFATSRIVFFFTSHSIQAISHLKN